MTPPAGIVLQPTLTFGDWPVLLTFFRGRWLGSIHEDAGGLWRVTTRLGVTLSGSLHTHPTDGEAALDLVRWHYPDESHYPEEA